MAAHACGHGNSVSFKAWVHALRADRPGLTSAGTAGPFSMNTPEQSQLGKSSAYIDQYAPSLLFPLPRAPKREEIGVQGSQMPFFGADRSEEHTSELQSRPHLVCRLLLEKKKNKIIQRRISLGKTKKLYVD